MNEFSNTNEFLRLFMDNQKQIYAYILGMVPNYEDAKDLFQETVLVMWSKFDSFQRGTDFTTWGITIAKYQILSVRKKYSKDRLRFNQAALGLLQKESETIIEQIDIRMEALRKCVRKLNRKDYELIRMRYEQEISIKTIAEQIGKTVQSIYKRLANIHDTLVRCIRRTIAREELA